MVGCSRSVSDGASRLAGKEASGRIGRGARECLEAMRWGEGTNAPPRQNTANLQCAMNPKSSFRLDGQQTLLRSRAAVRLTTGIMKTSAKTPWLPPAGPLPRACNCKRAEGRRTNQAHNSPPLPSLSSLQHVPLHVGRRLKPPACGRPCVLVRFSRVWQGNP